jgi:hypothetical protein
MSSLLYHSPPLSLAHPLMLWVIRFLQRCAHTTDTRSRLRLWPPFPIATGGVPHRRSKFRTHCRRLHTVRYSTIAADHQNFTIDELQYTPHRKTSRRWVSPTPLLSCPSDQDLMAQFRCFKLRRYQPRRLPRLPAGQPQSNQSIRVQIQISNSRFCAEIVKSI